MPRLLLLLFGGSAVAEVEIRRLRDELREKDGIHATPVKNAAMLMTVDIPRIFEEGHRYIQQKMKAKVCLWGFRRENIIDILTYSCARYRDRYPI